ncbi:MAG: hypothetical protein ACUVSY_07900 [Roseiflexus sp.]
MARSTRLTNIEPARYLVPELFVMAVVMRLIASLSIADVSLADDLQRRLYDPLPVFDTAFGAFMVAGMIVGALAHLSMRDPNTPALLLPTHVSDDDHRRLSAPIAVDRYALKITFMQARCPWERLRCLLRSRRFKSSKEVHNVDDAT